MGIVPPARVDRYPNEGPVGHAALLLSRWGRWVILCSHRAITINSISILSLYSAILPVAHPTTLLNPRKRLLERNSRGNSTKGSLIGPGGLWRPVPADVTGCLI